MLKHRIAAFFDGDTGRHGKPWHGGFFAEVPKLACLLLGVLMASSSQAMSLREFRSLEKVAIEGGNYANYYLVGVMEGAVESHLRDVRQGAKPSLCLDGRQLVPANAPALFDRELRLHPGVYEADMPVAFVMTQALAAAYACPR